MLDTIVILGSSIAATIGFLIAAIVLLAALLIGVMMVLNWWESRKGPRLNSSQLAEQLRMFLEAENWEHDREWDEFACVPIRDPEMDEIREHCVELSEKRVAIQEGTYFASEDEAVVRRYIEQLRQRQPLS